MARVREPYRTPLGRRLFRPAGARITAAPPAVSHPSLYLQVNGFLHLLFEGHLNR